MNEAENYGNSATNSSRIVTSDLTDKGQPASRYHDAYCDTDSEVIILIEVAKRVLVLPLIRQFNA